MNTLALEFSSDRRGVAVLTGGELRSRQETRDRRAGALGMVEAALREAGISRREIECVALGLGPGSYTGIRSAIALAQGWQLATGVRLCGVSSAEVIARVAGVNGVTGRVAVVIDAQRREFACAEFELERGGVRELTPLRIVTRDELLALASTGARLIGPAATEVGGQEVFPDAAETGRLAAQSARFFPGERIEAIYLRPAEFVKCATAPAADHS